MSYKPLPTLSLNHFFSPYEKSMTALIKTLDRSANAGLANDSRVQRAIGNIRYNLIYNRPIIDDIKSKYDIRALAIVLAEEDVRKNFAFTRELADKIERVRPKTSVVLYFAVFDFVFNEFDKAKVIEYPLYWLKEKRKERNEQGVHDEQVFDLDGPKWLAEQAVAEKKPMTELASEVGLGYVNAGRYMQLAKQHYYINQLKEIPVNEPHPILKEVSSLDVFESLYDKEFLMGHKIMEILIERAPEKNIHSDWLNVILGNAGDPRIPASHPRFKKWWNYLSENHLRKVRGWLSSLDLKLFLEAITNYAQYSRDDELMRMYPSRKAFLEGLFNQDLILETRLFVSANADQYLKENYKPSELPAYEVLRGSGDNKHKSLIYLKLTNGEMIEGSHSCYLRIFSRFTRQVPAVNYSNKQITYYTLTSQMDRLVENMALPVIHKITHNPELGWQRKAILALKELGIRVYPEDVLTPQAQKAFKRKFGIM
jgi:hypothetical protein